jgi:nucleoside-diphosphate-sugar epimerase
VGVSSLIPHERRNWGFGSRAFGSALVSGGGGGHFGGMKKTLLSIGHGYSAQALAAVLMPQGWRVIGTTRSSEKADAIRETGAEAVVWPGGSEDIPALQEASHLLVSAGPTEAGDPVLQILGRQIAAAAARLGWVGYLSTTAVYGDHGGGWVDETTPLTPASRRGRLRVQAEGEWAAIPGLALHIFRLAGIYGPGRGPFAKVRAGTARRIIKPGQVFSRIHVEDVAQVLAASMARPNPGAVYNLCDDDPAPPEAVIAYAAGLLGVPVPPAVAYEVAEMTPMARSFYGENKRVRNDRIKDELGVELRYPGYREGLGALVL